MFRRELLWLPVLLGLVALFAGCGDDTTCTPCDECDPCDPCDPCPQGYWMLQHPPINSGYLYGIFGLSDDNIYVVGDNGSFGHFDGDYWVRVPTKSRRTLRGVWAHSPSKVFAVGYDGLILHYDGSEVEQVPIQTSYEFYGVWGFSASDVYAIGSGYDVYHYDGTEWTSIKHWTDDYRYFEGIWGTSPTNIYAVGGYDIYGVSDYEGRIVRFNGTDWNEVDTGLDLAGVTLRAVWGSSSSDIYVVGDYQSSQSRNIVLHYNGSTWSVVEDDLWDGSSYYFYSVWGRNSNDVYIGNSSDRVFYYDGTSWEDITDYNVVDGDIYGLWASSSYVYGTTRYGVIPKWDGSTWTEAQGGPFGTLRSIWVGSENDAIAVGELGLIMRYDGTKWEDEVDGAYDNYSYYGISGVEDNWFVSGSNGKFLWNTGSGWDVAGGFDATFEPLYDVWAQGNEAIAVGDDGAIVHFDGTNQNLMTNGAPVKYDLQAVWGTSMTNVYAVGNEGTVIHYDGNASRRFEPIEDVAGTYDLWAVWGTSSSNIYIAGEKGFFARFNGTTWERLWVDETSYIRGINGTGPNNFYMCADYRIYHYDGTVMREVPQNVTWQTLYDVNLSQDGDLFACGYRGTIVYLEEDWE